MRGRRWIFGGVAAALVAAAWVGCQHDANPQLVPAPGTFPARSGRPVPGPTTTPIRREKPRMLGPVQPAIVKISTPMAEPAVRVRLTDETDAPPRVDGAKYRGKVEVVKLPSGKYVAINYVPMDRYIAGVLPKELYGSWDLETYKAQAVAARTYALFQMLTQGREKAWDVNNDESSQVYGGAAAETDKSRAAVAATRGRVLLASAQNESGIFCTFFSACTGGATQDPWEAWGDPSIGPLAARRLGNIDAACPKFAWPAMAVSKADISRAVAAWGERNSLEYLAGLGPIQRVVITKWNGRTGRPTEITVVDASNRTAALRAEEFRLALLNDPWGRAPRPPSSYFEIQDRGDHIVLANGRGHGHGIGMSQWGAQALALRGNTAEQILGFYYPGSTLVRAW